MTWPTDHGLFVLSGLNRAHPLCLIGLHLELNKIMFIATSKYFQTRSSGYGCDMGSLLCLVNSCLFVLCPFRPQFFILYTWLWFCPSLAHAAFNFAGVGVASRAELLGDEISDEADSLTQREVNAA